MTFLLLNMTAFFLISFCMLPLWWLGLKTNNAGVVDIFWSLLVGLAALYFIVMTEGTGIKVFLIALAIMIWALRLSFYIFYRHIKNPKEDKRYASLKEKWGDEAKGKMLKFYLQQGAGALLFAWPALFVGMNPTKGLLFIEGIGFFIILAGIVGETFADVQLLQFKADPENKGKVCRLGLWNYSRHPNYFFEWCVWVGMALYACGSPWGWVALICPISMYYFLNHVTGIPLAEAESLKSRGEEYEAYQKEVSVFFPWIRRSL